MKKPYVKPQFRLKSMAGPILLSVQSPTGDNEPFTPGTPGTWESVNPYNSEDFWL